MENVRSAGRASAPEYRSAYDDLDSKAAMIAQVWLLFYLLMVTGALLAPDGSRHEAQLVSAALHQDAHR